MEIGISTASLFGRYYNEDALPILEKVDARVVEVFLETYCEYTEEFAKLLSSRKGSLRVHSIHTLNTHFEPQLFSDCERTRNDALKIYESCLKSAEILGATAYTLHGKARFKRHVKYDNYQEIGGYMSVICDMAKKYGVDLCLENVEWAYYRTPGFFSAIKRYCGGLCACLDVKQARESGFDYKDYIEETGDAIKTVHLSDVDEKGRTALPTEKGLFDFEELFRILKYNGFCGDMLVEVYKDNFQTIDELKDSLSYLRNIKEKIF